MILRLPVFNQRETETRVAQTRIDQEQADQRQEQVKQQIRAEVIRSYYGVLVAEAKREVAAEAVKTAEAEVRRIRNFYQAGLVVQSDLLAAEVQLSEFRQQEIQAAGEVITTYAALNTALGLPIHTPQKVTGELTDRSFAVPGLEDLVQSALTHRPDFAQASLRVRSTDKSVRGAWGQYLPKVDVFSTYGLSGRDLWSGNSDFTIGAGMTYNFLDRSRSAKVDHARAARSMAAAEQEHLANQIRLEVVRAYQQYISVRERLILGCRGSGPGAGNLADCPGPLSRGPDHDYRSVKGPDHLGAHASESVRSAVRILPQLCPGSDGLRPADRRSALCVLIPGIEKGIAGLPLDLGDSFWRVAECDLCRG